MTCNCTHRRLDRKPCATARELGLTAAQFNILGEWPDDDEQSLSGSYGRLDSEAFMVSRQALRSLVGRGFALRGVRGKAVLTSEGREIQARIHASEHWRRTR